MELLNLDELIDVKRQVTIGGMSYDVADQTVGEMVEALRTAKTVQDNADDGEVMLSAMVSTAKRLIPDCPKDQIDRMTMRQLAALIEFASASDEQVAAEAEVEVVEDAETPDGIVLSGKTAP